MLVFLPEFLQFYHCKIISFMKFYIFNQDDRDVKKADGNLWQNFHCCEARPALASLNKKMRYWFPRSVTLPLSLYFNIVKKYLASCGWGKRPRCSQMWWDPKLEESLPYASDPLLLSQRVFWVGQKSKCTPPTFMKGVMWYSWHCNLE